MKTDWTIWSPRMYFFIWQNI